MEDFLRIGVITTTHGVRGEVKVFPTTDDPQRFEQLDQVILDTGRERRTLTVTGVKYVRQFVVLKFREFNNVNEVESLRQAQLYVRREDAVPCQEDENYIADLIDMEAVTEQGELLGTVVDVYETGANDVYVVRMKSGKELMIPAIKDCILDVNVEENRMTVHLLDGLMDL